MHEPQDDQFDRDRHAPLPSLPPADATTSAEASRSESEDGGGQGAADQGDLESKHVGLDPARPVSLDKATQPGQYAIIQQAVARDGLSVTWCSSEVPASDSEISNLMAQHFVTLHNEHAARLRGQA